ncbi:hypothetical protein CsSME_00032429 [Camellia sinensis var. sinensis]
MGDHEQDGEAIELAFSKKKIEARKNWLRQFEPGTYLDQKEKVIKYSDFVNKELILFSMADLQRSIPSMVDGLKPEKSTSSGYDLSEGNHGYELPLGEDLVLTPIDTVELPGVWSQQADPSQWSSTYYGYGQGYDAYGYGTTHDPSLYAYGAYPGYVQYPQQVDSVVYLVDAYDKERFAEAKKELDALHKKEQQYSTLLTLDVLFF